MTVIGESLSVTEFRDISQRIEREIAQVMVGQEAVVRDVLIAMLAGGHVLLEGVPGLGKTMLVRTFGDVLDLRFSRIQFTPDLMPADITGTTILVEDVAGHRAFTFQPGPVFANLILADEINRSTPKTQSALLEAMQDRTCTIGTTMHQLPEPFFVLATQNPLEMEGTYPLPEAQLDRFFFKVTVPFPTAGELHEILRRTTTGAKQHCSQVADGPTLLALGQLARQVPISSHVSDFVVRLVLATHPSGERSPDIIKRFVRYGASPRGAQAIVLGSKIRSLIDGRLNVSIEDVRKIALPALRHRIMVNFDAEASRVTTDDVLRSLLETMPESAA